MIKIENLNKYFNRFRKNQIHVINNTSLSLEDNGLVALLGPSGSGKTTLLNVIGGLDKANKGNVYINGKKITSRFSYKVDKIRNLNIGYIFQDYKLVGDLSVFDNVALVLKMIGVKDKKEIEERVAYVLEKVGMYRYRRRPANMLSGGERQRVGIARALVKNPSIIIADEPTGNLDSKNSLEIMNIIKAISKDRLVILVTHEVNLAKFYASRIIELSDGAIVNDYVNEHNNELEYSIDNRFYLKDFKNNEIISYNDYQYNIYSDDKEKIKLDIVIKNNNIYIRSKTDKKIEIVDDDTNIEFINDHYKNISVAEVNKYKFDFSKISNKKKVKYCSIFNPITFISNGFSKVFSYSLIKKILLLGFFLSGIFITFAFSRIVACTTIRDADFIKVNRNYLNINKKIKMADYIKYKNTSGVDYLLPGDSFITLEMRLDNYYQTANNVLALKGSLTSIDKLNKKDLIYGRMPENDREIVIDTRVIEKANSDVNFAKMSGLFKGGDYLNKSIKVGEMEEFKIVGISKTNDPLIFTFEKVFTNLIYYSSGKDDKYFNSDEIDSYNLFHDYDVFSNRINLVEGRTPENYEVVVPYSNKYSMPLGKEIENKINDKKLVVVGYYTSLDDERSFLVNNEMILYQVLSKTKNISLYVKSDKKSEVMNTFLNDYKVYANDTYQTEKDKYLATRKESMTATLIASFIIFAISLIEIFLMIRASFLSRVREVGIYRAIGVKKKDIYIMFSGEIIAITTLSCLPGIILCSYILNILTNISLFSRELAMNSYIVIVSVIFVYLFNLIIGLIPVYNTIKKRPAEILARTDI